VLVHAAAGGVGHIAVQLACHAGAHVIGTASAVNSTLVKSLGAHEVIDYRCVDFRSRAHAVDLVIDTVEGDTREKSWEVIRKGGRLIAMPMPPPAATVAAIHGVRCAMVAVVPDGERLEKIGAMIDAGQLRVLIDREYPLQKIADAHAHSEGRHACGKIVLRVC
jgi:NADPH:quinone reductase-like Zn-dependent oxidoreductase